jgi:hypothetical protein
VVFPRQVEKETRSDPRVREAAARLAEDRSYTQREYDEVYRGVYAEKQSALGARFDQIHDIARAKSVGSIHDVVAISELRLRVIEAIERGVART